jgi:hypothetical protein
MLACRNPTLSPQSYRAQVVSTAWNGVLPISFAIASVSWISPPAPFSRLSRIVKISGCKM